MSRRFPKTSFGICPKCGGRGDYDSTASGADATPPADVTGNGYELEWFRGELICGLCKKEILADEESLVIAEKDARSQEFRDRAGFTRRIT